eukprot:CAMPEP_0202743090 /NCGR_PEP_ID=MMETSP1388-20130828/5532_1 /ASSEMBLY_ACC=CAM_ASM_000864 /TAXON_ID=37098 /ORGANISM="Isochrysis sp, Strain CCMP1244" /LENGTH=218 /DNA_ID=CAMNT_0049410081 /DNA_START=131 /DNA_END=783 /DNA_ORIENTATION=+
MEGLGVARRPPPRVDQRAVQRVHAQAARFADGVEERREDGTGARRGDIALDVAVVGGGDAGPDRVSEERRCRRHRAPHVLPARPPIGTRRVPVSTVDAARQRQVSADRRGKAAQPPVLSGERAERALDEQRCALALVPGKHARRQLRGVDPLHSPAGARHEAERPQRRARERGSPVDGVTPARPRTAHCAGGSSALWHEVERGCCSEERAATASAKQT